MWNQLLDDVEASGCYTKDDRQFMSHLLEQHIAHFDYSESPRLLHMDVWSQNVLVNLAGKVSGLVDFDRALWGDPEIEFAVLDYCGTRHAAFWQGYGSERNQFTSAQIRQLFYLLYESQKYMSSVTSYFVGSVIGSFLGAYGWNLWRWNGVCAIGLLLLIIAFAALLLRRKRSSV